MQENQNVCMFIPPQNSEEIYALHFVYETKTQIFDGWKTLPYYKMHVVLDGEGILHTHNGEYNLKKGDVFFCLPACPFGLESRKDFKFAYVSFLGNLANKYTDQLKITAKNCVFSDFSQIIPIWESALNLPTDVSFISSQGVVFLTFSHLLAKTLCAPIKKKEINTALIIKKYIDDNFSNPNLSLTLMCKNLSYNPKYISAIFKNHFKITFKEYLNVIRINNACILMEKGFTGIKDVASLCGFNDSLYFSKVFKKRTNLSPTKYIADLSSITTKNIN